MSRPILSSSKDPRPVWMRHYDDDEIQKMVLDDTDDYAHWFKKGEVHEDNEATYTYCMARALVSHNGFYYFCRDIMDYQDMEPNHKDVICPVLANPKYSRTLLQVNRGSFKSSIGTVGYSCWLIARTMVLTPPSKVAADHAKIALDDLYPSDGDEPQHIWWGNCNIRILLGSEALYLAKGFATTVNRTLHHNAVYHRYFGQHRPLPSAGRLWKDNEFISAFRTKTSLNEPTMTTLSKGAPRHGMHFDAIIPDDLQAETTSSSPEQIDNLWNFFQLLFSLLEPTWAKGHDMWRVLPAGPHFGMRGTRWHFDDIYQRIEEDNPRREPEDRFEILYIPVIDSEESKDGRVKFGSASGEPNFPERFPMSKVEQLRKEHGRELFASQYLLNPTPEESRPIKEEWVGHTTDEVIADPAKYGTVGGGSDWAWTARVQSRKGGHKAFRRADHTVHLFGCINRKGQVHVTHGFRGKVTPWVGIENLFDLYETTEAVVVGLQRYDQAHIDDLLERVAADRREFINYEFIAYPQGSKEARIKNVLQTMFERRKIFINPQLDWLVRECVDFPNSITDDAIDALCNMVKVLLDRVPRAPREVAPGVPDTAVARRVLRLRKGIVTDANGNPLKPNKGKPTY